MELFKSKPKILLRIQQCLWILLILTLFFPIRYVFNNEYGFITGAYSDFTSFSLYLSDILLIALILAKIPSIWVDIKTQKRLLALGLILLGLLITKIDFINQYNFYFELRLIELFFVYVLFYGSNLNYRILISFFGILGGVQSLLAGVQFIWQRSLGLFILGETALSPEAYGIAKIVSHGTKYLRGYGTFPHPNLLAAFLFTAILFSIYLVVTAESKRNRIIYSAILAVNVFGLFLSFSRAAMLMTAISTAIFFAWLIIKKTWNKRVLSTILIGAVTSIIAIIALSQFIFTRATINDQAVVERKFYNQIGLEIIKSNWGQGTGLGRSILNMQQHSPIKLQTWEIQPIHNYYLIALAELGIIGGGAIIIFILWHLYRLGALLYKQIAPLTEKNLIHLTLFCILLGYLGLMMFDHYFYTLHQTQILLWGVLGLIAVNLELDKKV